MAAIPWKVLAGLGHEAGGYVVFCAEGFDDISVGVGTSVREVTK